MRIWPNSHDESILLNLCGGQFCPSKVPGNFSRILRIMYINMRYLNLRLWLNPDAQNRHCLLFEYLALYRSPKDIFLYILFLMRLRTRNQVFLRERWNSKTVIGLTVAKAKFRYKPTNQELKLGERKWLDTVVVPAINYANKMLARYHWLDSTSVSGKLKVFEFWGEYGCKTET